jgi:hypothetical protein
MRLALAFFALVWIRVATLLFALFPVSTISGP